MKNSRRSFLICMSGALASLALVPQTIAGLQIPEWDCQKLGHQYGGWYRQCALFFTDKLFLMPEQAARVCQLCGEMQTASGRYHELVRSGPTGEPAGTGDLSRFDAQLELEKGFAMAFWIYRGGYEGAPVENRYRRGVLGPAIAVVKKGQKTW